MSGGSTQQTQQTQQASTQPWGPSQPLLNNIIQGLGGLNTNVTGGQSDALTNLQNAAAGIPSFGPQATGAVNGMLSGGNANSFAPLYQNAYSTLQGQLTPYASGANLDPYSNPGFKTAMDTNRQDITNQINSQFAAAGRDLSPANSQALARGITQGAAPTIANQFNQNVGNQLGAANALYGAGSGTAGALAGLNQYGISNQLQGLGAAGMIPSLLTQGPQAQLAAANAAYSQPYGNIGLLASLGIPIAALGSQSTGSAQGTTTQQTDPLSNILGATFGTAGLLGKMNLLPKWG